MVVLKADWTAPYRGHLCEEHLEMMLDDGYEIVSAKPVSESTLRVAWEEANAELSRIRELYADVHHAGRSVLIAIDPETGRSVGTVYSEAIIADDRAFRAYQKVADPEGYEHEMALRADARRRART
jgi:hypothetical protein